MCKKIRKEKFIETAFTGSFFKGNEAKEMMMWIFLAPCQCGKKVWGYIEDDGGSAVEIVEAKD